MVLVLLQTSMFSSGINFLFTPSSLQVLLIQDYREGNLSFFKAVRNSSCIKSILWHLLCRFYWSRKFMRGTDFDSSSKQWVSQLVWSFQLWHYFSAVSADEILFKAWDPFVSLHLHSKKSKIMTCWFGFGHISLAISTTNRWGLWIILLTIVWQYINAGLWSCNHHKALGQGDPNDWANKRDFDFVLHLWLVNSHFKTIWRNETHKRWLYCNPLDIHKMWNQFGNGNH